uniref:MATH domain-containing protein n=1 Tax=Oryza rufipogon TaxID=4529 RepID=A0A0E0QZC9_ORYRU
MSEVKTFCEGCMSWGHSNFIEREDFEKSKNLRDDSFTVRCDIVVVCKIRVARRRRRSPSPARP